MCTDCLAARETSGHWRFFDPRCLWCGARLIQRIGKLNVMPSEIRQRRQAVLKDWVAQGHAESEIRALAAAKTPAYEAITKQAAGTASESPTHCIPQPQGER